MGLRLAYYRFLMRQGPVEFSRGLAYSRFVEYPRVVEALGLRREDSLLDVGSRYSPLPQVLGLEHLCSVMAVDPEPGFRRKQLAMAERVPAAKALVEKGRLDFREEDAADLSFPDDSFSRVAVISVLEHIVDETAVVRELSRVLAPGGRLVISVPYDPWRDEPKYYRGNAYVHEDKTREEFYMRYYNDENLQERLIKPSGLRLGSISYFGEPGFNAHNLLYGNPKIPWPVKRLVFQPLVPILAPVFIRDLEPGRFRRKSKMYTADTAVVVLEK